MNIAEKVASLCVGSKCPSHTNCDICMYEKGRADAIAEISRENRQRKHDIEVCKKFCEWLVDNHCLVSASAMQMTIDDVLRDYFEIEF